MRIEAITGLVIGEETITGEVHVVTIFPFLKKDCTVKQTNINTSK